MEGMVRFHFYCKDGIIQSHFNDSLEKKGANFKKLPKMGKLSLHHYLAL